MKKLLYLFIALAIISCSKEEDILSQAEQEIENAKLVGEWAGWGEYDKHSMTITELFEMTIIYPDGNEVHCKYHLNKGMIILDEGEYFDWGRSLYYYYGLGELYISDNKTMLYFDRGWQKSME